MQQLKSLAQGFLVATGLIWVFNIATLMIRGDAWLGAMYMLILLIPITSLLILRFKCPRPQPPEGNRKWRLLLFSFQGVALGFWMFDLITTFYAINVTGLAVELNPLGWPWGMLGAFVFYGPAVVFSYVLLFKIREKHALYAALPLTLLTVGMSLMNFAAGAQNFQVFIDTASLAVGVRLDLLALLVTVNFVVPLVLRWSVTHPKTDLKLKHF